MRKLLRQMAKAKMKRMGASKVNRAIGSGRWRSIVGAYPIDTITGERMKRNYHGQKKYKPGSYANHLFSYST